MSGEEAPRPSRTPAPRRPRDKPLGLPRHRRLRGRRDFVRTERQGVRVSGALVIVCGRPGATRIGFTVSKKVGDAVARNRVKRLLREIARHEKALWRGRDVVLIARPEAASASLEALRHDVVHGFAQLSQKLTKSKSSSPSSSSSSSSHPPRRPDGPPKEPGS